MPSKWRVLLLDTKHSNPNHYIVLGIEDALRAHPDVEQVFYASHADALPTAVHQDCNLFIAVDGEELDRGLCCRLASVCGTSVLWLWEDPYCRPYNLRNAPLFDVVFTNDADSVKYYTAPCAHHLPLAASARFNYREIPSADTDAHYLFDILFVGTAWPNRVTFFKQLLPKLKGLRLKLGLPCNPHIPVPDLGMAPSSYLWRVPNTELCRLANRSRVVLSLQRDFGSGPNTPTCAATPGPRLFETALAGGFQLVDSCARDTPAFFTVGQEIATFRTVGECRDQIQFFLANPDSRLRMARHAQRRCFNEDLYRHRIEQMLDVLAGAVASRTSQTLVPSIQRRKVRVLYVVHNVINGRPWGGVEVYVDLLARRLPPEYKPYLYYPDPTCAGARIMTCEDVRGGTRKLYELSRDIDPHSLQDFERESCFARVLDDFRIDLVHVQHLIHHPWSLPLVARTHGLPVVFTFSDHYLVCDHFNLLNANRQFCHINERPPATCDVCLKAQDQALPGSQASRRSFIAAILDNIDLAVFLNQSALDIAQAIYPGLKNPARILVEGFPLNDASPVQRARRPNQRLKVVTLGNFDYNKGAETLLAVFDAMRADNVEFHVHGTVRPPYEQRLQALNGDNVAVHGGYQPDALAAELCDADLALLLSLWPETYVLTLSEAWRAGVVPVVTDVGALGHRVVDGVNGFKVPIHEPGCVIEILRNAINEPAELDRMRININSGLYRTIGDHVKLLTGKYDELLDRSRAATRSAACYAESLAPSPAAADNVFRRDSLWMQRVPSPPPPPQAPANVGPSQIVSQPASKPPLLRRALTYYRRRGFAATTVRVSKEISSTPFVVTRLSWKAVRFFARHGAKATIKRVLERVRCV